VHDDPTRMMPTEGGEPPRRQRPPQRPRGNMRLVVAGLCAVIFGLFIAILVGSGGGGTTTITETKVITKEVPAKTSTEGEEGEEESEEGEEGEEEGSGGIEAEEGSELEEGAIEELPEGEILPEEEGEGGGISP
jgi:hypothetical protein